MLKVNDHLYVEVDSKKRMSVFWRKFSIPEGLMESLHMDEFSYPYLDWFNSNIYENGRSSVVASSWIGFLEIR